MDTLQTELAKLSDHRLNYVMARSKVNSDAAAYRDAGIPKASFYKWEQAERDSLNDLAMRIKRETAFQAIMILQEAAEKAAQVKVDGLDARDPRIKQAAATEILDRIVGKPTQRQEVTGAEGGTITVELIGDDEA